MTIRLYSSESLASGVIIELTKEQTHYLKSVMRVRTSQRIKLFNSIDGEWIAEIEDDRNKSILCSIVDKIRDPNAPNAPEIDFFIPLVKPDTISRIIRQVTELNVSKIRPYIAKYSNIRDINYKRMESIIIEATEQSGRIHRPSLYDVIEFNEIVDTQNNIDGICFYGDPKSQNTYQDMKDWIKKKFKNNTISIIIGPEGGFHDNELEIFRKNKKFIPINLNSTILKCDTASVALMQTIIAIYNIVAHEDK